MAVEYVVKLFLIRSAFNSLISHLSQSIAQYLVNTFVYNTYPSMHLSFFFFLTI